MRIAIDALLLGTRDSGVEVCIRHLVKALAKVDERNEYVIYVKRGAGGLGCESNPRFRVVTTDVPSRVRTLRILWEQAVLPKRLKSDDIDVLHAPGYVMPLQAETPTVVTMHDLITLTHPELCKATNAAHYRLLLGRTARRAARIVASSEATKADIVSRLGVDAQKVEVVPLGVGDAFFCPVSAERRAEVKARYKLPDRFILFVGNLEPKKNLPTLVSSVALLKANGRLRHTLVIAGKKGWKHESIFRAVRRARLEADALFCDYVAQDDLPALYQMADLFVFPSLCEGFGIPPLEAMASGTPVVVSDAPALAESAGDAALVYSPNTAQELAKAIHKVLSNTFLRSHLAARGRDRAQRFRWEETARRMVRIYESVGQRP